MNLKTDAGSERQIKNMSTMLNFNDRIVLYCHRGGRKLPILDLTISLFPT